MNYLLFFKMINKLILWFLCLIVLSSCVVSPPIKTTNICEIFYEKRNIQTRVIFTGNILRQPGFKFLNKSKNSASNFKNADYVLNEVNIEKIGKLPGLEEMNQYMDSIGFNAHHVIRNAKDTEQVDVLYWRQLNF